ncbi:BLUF domain-containing protein [Bradyrhizobium japonicum]|uniref:BLUF domain-containing protein n=1 Tax=Bradyrhizobium japonicum TaxID=375 RepID=UPI001BABB422|nr:BLUF domain-containing protein [Bradyrhizobium japonicum]MBR0995667.1 BLUF domain-containing protein [Bradyrhizobium japonicum]
MLLRLTYQSRNLLKRPNGSSELLNIVRSAERNNLALALTGALLFDKDQFFQVLEGEANRVTGLFVRIAQDARHTDICLIDAKSVFDRRFPNWSMALIERPLAPLAPDSFSADDLLNFMCDQLAESSGPIKVAVPVW